MALKTVLHAASDIVSIKVFPGGNAGVTDAAFCLSMLFMGKTERFLVALAFALGMPRFFEVAQTTVGLFPRLEMALETTLFSGPTKSIVNLNFQRTDSAGTSIYCRSAPQRLPTGRQAWHAL